MWFECGVRVWSSSVGFECGVTRLIVTHGRPSLLHFEEIMGRRQHLLGHLRSGRRRARLERCLERLDLFWQGSAESCCGAEDWRGELLEQGDGRGGVRELEPAAHVLQSLGEKHAGGEMA